MTAPANEKVVSMDMRKLVTLAKQECGFEEEQISRLEDFLAEKKFRVSAGELARKLAELGAPREGILAFLRKFKVEDNYIAQAMRYVSRTKPMENPRTSMPEADAENGVPNEVRLDFSKYRKVRKPLRGVKG